jgi:hypothetical protein
MRWWGMEAIERCTRCGRDVRCLEAAHGRVDLVCTGCLTLSEDVADTAAFAAACDRAARNAECPEVARRARAWMELALENLVRRHNVGYENLPLTLAGSADG